MTDTESPGEMTKDSFRKKVWDSVYQNPELYRLNGGFVVYEDIPHFVGAEEAAQRLANLDEFKMAKIIQINPNKPQEPVRLLALKSNKEILVPVPGLKSGPFMHITPPVAATTEDLTIASKIVRGLPKRGKPVRMDSDIKVDLVILGSVCVSCDGYRLGTGKGFTDLEFAMMMRMGAVTQDTTIITTVHDSQVMNKLPPELFQEYDVPVDIIVTPTKTIHVNQKLKKPTNILWHVLSRRRFETIKLLHQLRNLDENDGNPVTLKEVDSETETEKPYRRQANTLKKMKRTKSRKDVTNSDSSIVDEEKKKNTRPRVRRKFASERKGEKQAPSNVTQTELKNNEKDRESRHRSKKLKSRSRSQIDFSLKLSNISLGVRVRDLKNALLSRGVKPREISWQGSRGVCYVHFSKLRNENAPMEQPVQVDSIIANLQDLRIGESANNENDFIIVQPAKPISRIEVTDISTV